MTQVFRYECQCKGKRQFDNRKLAKVAMRKLFKTGTSPSEVSVYNCPHCEFWHIGRTPRSQR